MSQEELLQFQQEIYQAKCELAREDINEFIELCFLDDDTQEPIVQQWFHRKMQAMLPDQPAKVMYILPRGSGKSQQMSVFRTVWDLGKNPNLRIKIITATDNLAVTLLNGIKKAIENNEHVRNVFPRLRPSDQESWTTHRIMVERSSGTGHPSVEALGVLSTGAGGRSDRNIYDDVVDMKNSILMPTLRDHVKQSIRETWQPLLVPTGTEIWNATPYHHLDATNELRNADDSEWMRLIIPAILSKDVDLNEVVNRKGRKIELFAASFAEGKSYWPTKWTFQELEKKRRSSPRGFDKQYLLKIVPEEEAIFPPGDIVRCLNLENSLWDVDLAKGVPRYIDP